MRSNDAEARPQHKILGRFHCQETLQSVPPFLTYRARAQGLAGFERIFAVKVLPADTVTTRPDAAQRLMQAAARANAAKDVRLGQVVDSGTAPDGSIYIATEFVFGLTLAGLRDGALVEASTQPTPTTMLVAHLAAEIAGALAAAHEMRPPLIHGALSPSNTFLTIRGAVKVIDFGQRMAVLPGRLAGGKRALSDYAAPELLLAGDGSAEADVFALGSMIFEVATGKTPPSARNPRSATDLARTLNPLPLPLAEVITSLLRLDPLKRPSARAAEQAFRHIAAGLSEAELRAHLAGLARQLSAPQTRPTSAQSMVMPALVVAEDLASKPERHTAPTVRPPAPVLEGPGYVSPQPMNTLPFADLIQNALPAAFPQGVAPSNMLELSPDDLDVEPKPPARPPRLPQLAVAGQAVARPRPNMENITTGEMDAMFAPDTSNPLDPPTSTEAPGLANLMVGDFADDAEDAKTNAFRRSMFAKRQANDVEAKLELGSALPLELVLSSDVGNATAVAVPHEEAPEAPTMDAAPAALAATALGNDGDAGQAYENMPAVGDEPDEFELAGKRAGKRRLLITLGTAAVVAMVAGLAGSVFMGRSKRPVSTRSIPLPEVTSGAAAPTPPEPATVAPQEDPTATPVQSGGGPAPRDVQGRLRLTFKTQPPGAMLWINGGARGLSPVKTDLKERHKDLVIIKAGFKRVEKTLNHATLMAEETFELQPVQAPQGNATIRVQCEQEGKYPISIDGMETGLLCPADVSVAAGDHLVEVLVPWRFKSYGNLVVVGARKTKITKFSK